MAENKLTVVSHPRIISIYNYIKIRFLSWHHSWYTKKQRLTLFPKWDLLLTEKCLQSDAVTMSITRKAILDKMMNTCTFVWKTLCYRSMPLNLRQWAFEENDSSSVRRPDELYFYTASHLSSALGFDAPLMSALASVESLRLLLLLVQLAVKMWLVCFKCCLFVCLFERAVPYFQTFS